MTELIKSEMRPDLFVVREQTLHPLTTYCSLETGNKNLTQLKMEHMKDYHAIKIFCGCITNWDGEGFVLYDNTLYEKLNFTLKQGIIIDLENQHHLNFILKEDLKDMVTLLYFNKGKEFVTIPANTIELFIHSLKLANVESKIYINKHSYVR